MRDYFIALDVGGSSIKSTIVDKKGNVITNICVRDSLAKENKESIIKNFIEIIKLHISESDKLRGVLKGVGIAFPGPFDYKNGISLIRGIDKYETLYRVNIGEELKKVFPSLEFRFKNDAHLYALGECNFRAGKDFNKLLCICIGTGIGSAFVENKRLIYGGNGIPEEGWIYNNLFKDSIADDYISARGLLKLSKEFKLNTNSVKEIYDLACKSDSRALEVFNSFGKDIKELMEPYIKRGDIDAVIIGGNIAKAYEFFKEDLENICINNKVKVLISKDSTESTLIAVPMLFEE